MDHGFLGQLIVGNVTTLTMEEKIQNLTEKIAKMDVQFNMKMTMVLDNLASMQDKEHATDRNFEERVALATLPMVLELHTLQEKVHDLSKKVHNVSEFVVFLKKETVLSNKVKKRVALTSQGWWWRIP